MARRRVDLEHPRPEAVAETVRQDKTSFAGAAGFLAGEGAFAFAADREGLAGAFDRVWLRPSSARRLAGFLDLRPPGVIGYRVAIDQGAPAQLAARPTALETIRATLRSMEGKMLSSERQLCMASVREADGGWPLEATLAYQHHFKLSGGHWSVDQPLVPLRLTDSDDEPLLAALISRPEDITQVRFAAQEIERCGDGLILEELALPEDAADRHRALREVLAALGDPTRLRVGSYHTRERERKAGDPPADEWGAHNEATSYRMRPHPPETMFKRVEEVDDTSLARVLAYLPDPSGLVVAVTLRQNPRRDDHLGLYFYTARHREEPEAPLSRESWDAARPVDWDEREKRRRILDLWVAAVSVLIARTSAAGEEQATAPPLASGHAA
jgi:hypothetical protein